jgi:phosphate:Na+ symporter
MMGAEIGTCSDTLFATIGGSKSAIRAGVYHLVFNIFSVALGLLLFAPFVHFVEWASFGAGPARQLANGHMYFNTIGVLLALPFTGYAAKLLIRWVKKATVGLIFTVWHPQKPGLLPDAAPA